MIQTVQMMFFSCLVSLKCPQRDFMDVGISCFSIHVNSTSPHKQKLLSRTKKPKQLILKRVVSSPAFNFVKSH